jgi:hypothetical protein
MKNKKPTFFLLFIVSGAGFISKKIKEQGFLRKSRQKTYPLDPGSGKNSSRIRIRWCCGSGLDRIPDLEEKNKSKKRAYFYALLWIRIRNPDSYWESGSRARKFRNFSGKCTSSYF